MYVWYIYIYMYICIFSYYNIVYTVNIYIYIDNYPILKPTSNFHLTSPIHVPSAGAAPAFARAERSAPPAARGRSGSAAWGAVRGGCAGCCRPRRRYLREMTTKTPKCSPKKPIGKWWFYDGFSWWFCMVVFHGGFWWVFVGKNYDECRRKKRCVLVRTCFW